MGPISAPLDVKVRRTPMTHNPVSFSRMLTARLTERKNRSWSRNLTLAVMVCTFGIGLFLPGVALAARAHGFEGVFGGVGEGAGESRLVGVLPEAGVVPGAPGSGVAVDGVTGDVFVADTGNRRVDEFAGDGAFVRAWG